MNSLQTDDNDFKFYISLDDAKADGWSPVPVRNLLQFFTMESRKTTMTKENLVPLHDQPYVVLGTDQRYYLKTYRNYNVDTLYFYFQDKISPVDEAIEQLRSYVLDEKVWILFDKTQVDDMKKMLERVFKSKISGEGTLTYKSFIDILDLEIRLQDYRRIGSNLPGSRTVVNQFDLAIADQWRKVYEKNIK
jgi:hypothetical protein